MGGFLPGENSINFPVPNIAQPIIDILSGGIPNFSPWGMPGIPGYNGPPIFDADPASNNHTPPIWCNPTTGICVPWSMANGPSNFQRFKKAAKWYLCGNSPADNIKNWTLEGGAKGVAVGSIAGGVTGTIFGTPVGGFAGAILGGLVEGTVGAGTGVFAGSAASLACSSFGVY